MTLCTLHKDTAHFVAFKHFASQVKLPAAYALLLLFALSHAGSPQSFSFTHCCAKTSLLHVLMYMSYDNKIAKIRT
jgi:hypothetical protein